MKARSLVFVFTAVASLGLALPASAGTINLSPTSASVGVGDTVSVDVVFDFSDGAILGGGFDVFFNSAVLGFVSFEFEDSASVGDDPSFRRAPDVLAGELNGIGFGNFEGIDGASLLGVLTFEALAVGTSALTLAENEGGPPDNPGGFFSIAGTPIDVDFGGADVAVVPLPAGLLLMLSALGALRLVRTRR